MAIHRRGLVLTRPAMQTAVSCHYACCTGDLYAHRRFLCAHQYHTACNSDEHDAAVVRRCLLKQHLLPVAVHRYLPTVLCTTAWSPLSCQPFRTVRGVTACGWTVRYVCDAVLNTCAHRRCGDASAYFVCLSRGVYDNGELFFTLSRQNVFFCCYTITSVATWFLRASLFVTAQR